MYVKTLEFLHCTVAHDIEQRHYVGVTLKLLKAKYSPWSQLVFLYTVQPG